ncbi:hypothetical protein GSI_02178 [Ganoderma sinense ZZ0214-1]|uniref:triacylglycerol lipase n=1 Tax=Ganoderma sinense ZZ0214-1 TaxID=1077348 RepID=A0A2G8SNW5_9APHY|nr:hypothetical protein GSI_02178 [Ganoderma sinense ZZ0214-1]
MLFSTVTSRITSFLAASSSLWNHARPPKLNAQPRAAVPTATAAALQFELRHLHATSADGRVLLHDVQEAGISALALGGEPTTYPLRTQRVTTHRPASMDAFHNARVRSMRFRENAVVDWDKIEVDGPDVNDRETLLVLAKMANNAYLLPDEQGWYPLGKYWNDSIPVGWEPDDDGFRGHVFATPDNSTVVLSIKGTSAAFIGGGGPTSKKDKLNDNMLFSCCCAHVDWTWTAVCGCYRGGWKCDQNCLEDAMVEDGLFYPTGINLYNNISYLYPNSDIWVTGHSLGGALASLLSVTFGAPAVAIESPGEKMASSRLHLPSPPETQPITHLYHTADPIAMGTCNGVLSSCFLGGYAMESRCHLGKSIVYDTVSNLSWSVDIRTHTIVNVIEKLLADPWPPAVDQGREVPEPVTEEDCIECYSWDFGDYPSR